jgi:hypothetical protein
MRDDFDANTIFLDPLEDDARCERDIPYLKALGINTLFTAYLHPGVSHNTCMQRFRDADIYIIAGLSGISEEDNIGGTWSYTLQQRHYSIADSLAPFSNLLGFLLMNPDLHYSPVLKATVQDLKEHLQTAGYRPVPVGAGAYLSTSLPIIDYVRCYSPDSSVDFLLYWGFTKCPPTQLAHAQDSMNALAIYQRDMPVVLFTFMCGSIDVLLNSNTFLSLNAENYTILHSGGFLVYYFDGLDGNGTMFDGKCKLHSVKNL